MKTLIINEQTSSILSERILTSLANIGMCLRYLRILKKVRMELNPRAYLYAFTQFAGAERNTNSSSVGGKAIPAELKRAVARECGKHADVIDDIDYVPAVAEEGHAPDLDHCADGTDGVKEGENNHDELA